MPEVPLFSTRGSSRLLWLALAIQKLRADSVGGVVVALEVLVPAEADASAEAAQGLGTNVKGLIPVPQVLASPFFPRILLSRKPPKLGNQPVEFRSFQPSSF